MSTTISLNSDATGGQAETSLTESQQDRVVRRLERLAHWLDSSIRIPVIGYRIGWDTVIGLVPGVGDSATAAVSLWLFLRARTLGLSRGIQFRMLTNIGIDMVLGTIPVAGDFFDAWFRCNQRNIRLLRRGLQERNRATGRQRVPQTTDALPKGAAGPQPGTALSSPIPAGS